MRASYPKTNGTTRIGFMLVLGIALLYTGIALASTLAMATSDRVRDLAVLRLAGATTWQVLRMVAAEALMVVVVGTVLGALVAASNRLGLWAALGILEVWTSIAVPWEPLGITVGACAVLAVLSAVVTAGLSMRRSRSSRRAYASDARRGGHDKGSPSPVTTSGWLGSGHSSIEREPLRAGHLVLDFLRPAQSVHRFINRQKDCCFQRTQRTAARNSQRNRRHRNIVGGFP